MPLKIDNAYFAGLMDGEGCFGFYRHTECPSYVYVRVGCTNTARAPLDDMAISYGGTVHRCKRRPNRKPVYEYVVYAEKSRKLIKSVLPYLRIKKAKARKCLEVLDAKKSI